MFSLFALFLAALLNLGVYLAAAIAGGVSWLLWSGNDEPKTRFSVLTRSVSRVLAVIALGLLSVAATSSAVIVTFILG